MLHVWYGARLLQVEKSSDDTVKLKILQTALTLLQNPHNVDDKVCHPQQPCNICGADQVAASTSQPAVLQ